MAPHYYKKINKQHCYHWFLATFTVLWLLRRRKKYTTIKIFEGVKEFLKKLCSGLGFKILFSWFNNHILIDNMPFSLHPLIKLKHNSTTAKKRLAHLIPKKTLKLVGSLPEWKKCQKMHRFFSFFCFCPLLMFLFCFNFFKEVIGLRY